jgi:hypothetical protein
MAIANWKSRISPFCPAQSLPSWKIPTAGFQRVRLQGETDLKIVSITAQPRIAHRILRHLRGDRCQARDFFEARPPSRAGAFSLQ